IVVLTRIHEDVGELRRLGSHSSDDRRHLDEVRPCPHEVRYRSPGGHVVQLRSLHSHIRGSITTRKYGESATRIVAGSRCPSSALRVGSHPEWVGGMLRMPCVFGSTSRTNRRFSPSCRWSTLGGSSGWTRSSPRATTVRPLLCSRAVASIIIRSALRTALRNGRKSSGCFGGVSSLRRCSGRKGRRTG